MPAITRTKNVIVGRIHNAKPPLRNDAIGPSKLAYLSKRYNTVEAQPRDAPLGESIRNSNAFVNILAGLEAPITQVTRKDKLKGWQFAVKDNICTADLPTTCASAMLQQFQSPFDATVVENLKSSGATVVGKTNMDEFGMGSHSTYSYFGPVKRKGGDGEDYSSGGSSGGSAVAMAEMVGFRGALGTDTGGSVRLPAAYTGVGGFKPSYGALSRWGVVPYANSLDTVGLFSHLEHALPIFDELNHHDPKDPTSLSPHTRARIKTLYGAEHSHTRPSWMNYQHLRIGVPQEYIVAELAPEVREAWSTTLRSFQNRGHTLVPVSLPTTKLALSAYYVIAPAEASSNLAKYDGVRYGTRSDGPDGADGFLFSKTRGEGFGDEVKRRILLGSYTLSADAIDNYFIQAQKVRRLVQQDFDRVFRQPNVLNVDELSTGWKEGGVDILVCPTAPSLPPSLAEVEQMSPLQSYVNDVFTVPASLAGLPAISMPYRRSSKVDQAPQIGIQIIGQFGMDSLVCRVANGADRYQKKMVKRAVNTSIESLSPESPLPEIRRVQILHSRIPRLKKSTKPRSHSKLDKSARTSAQPKAVESKDLTSTVTKTTREGPRVDKVQAYVTKKWRSELPEMSLDDYFKTLQNAKPSAIDTVQVHSTPRSTSFSTSVREIYGQKQRVFEQTPSQPPTIPHVTATEQQHEPLIRHDNTNVSEKAVDSPKTEPALSAFRKESIKAAKESNGEEQKEVAPNKRQPNGKKADGTASRRTFRKYVVGKPLIKKFDASPIGDGPESIKVRFLRDGKDRQESKAGLSAVEGVDGVKVRKYVSPEKLSLNSTGLKK